LNSYRHLLFSKQ